MFGLTGVWCLLVTAFTFYLSFHGSWDYVVSIAPRLWTGQLRNCGLILGKGKRFPPSPPTLQSINIVSGIHPVLLFNGYWGLFLPGQTGRFFKSVVRPNRVSCTFIACTGTYLWLVYLSYVFVFRFYFALLYQHDTLWDGRINLNGCQEEWWLIVLTFYNAVLIYELMRICEMSQEG